MKILVLTASFFLLMPLTAQAQITRGEFENTINQIIAIYDSELSSNRFVDIDWESETENASVSIKSGKVNFIFHGGFARKFKLTKDAMALIACHEVGHVIGGHPKVMPTQKYSAEGQSDYFATKECLKKYFKVSSNTKYNFKDISSELISKCDGNQECLRGLVAIKNASVIYEGQTHINHESKHISPFTVFNDYPQGQCRVDTLKAGLFNEARPVCWFRDFQKERYEYQEGYIYEEAQGVADITEVTQTNYGCLVKTSYPNYWMGSYLNPLSESEIMLRGVRVVGACPYIVGGVLSGSMTLFRDDVYLNLRNTDK